MWKVYKSPYPLLSGSFLGFSLGILRSLYVKGAKRILGSPTAFQSF